jgi:hypothetical protein
MRAIQLLRHLLLMWQHPFIPWEQRPAVQTRAGAARFRATSIADCCTVCFAACRWSKALVSQLAQGHPHTNLTIRMQGPYADPPADVGQPDGVILVAGESDWTHIILWRVLFSGESIHL